MEDKADHHPAVAHPMEERGHRPRRMARDGGHPHQMVKVALRRGKVAADRPVDGEDGHGSRRHSILSMPRQGAAIGNPYLHQPNNFWRAATAKTAPFWKAFRVTPKAKNDNLHKKTL